MLPVKYYLLYLSKLKKMKNSILILAVVAMTVFSCKKKDVADTEAPVIVLNGSTNDTLSLNKPYVELGASVSDNVDKSLSTSVVISGSVNKDLTGDYKIFYNVKDAAGNAAEQVVRNVNVRNDANYLVGFYNATPNCGATSTSTFVTQLKVSNTINNRIEFSVGSYFTATNPTIEVTGTKINIPYFNSGTGSSYSATGDINANKKSFTLVYTVTSPNWTWNCSTNYVKQ